MTDALPDGYTLVSVDPEGNLVGDTWTIGNLALNGTATLTITASVNSSGNYLNIASIQGDEEDPNPDNDEDDATTTPVPVADLGIDKSVNNATPNVGENVTFTLVATNYGPSPATNVTVTDALPDGYTLVSVDPDGDLIGNTWSIGDLALNGTATLTITASVNASGNYLNVASIEGDEEDPNPGNDEDDAATTPVPLGSISGTVTADLDQDDIGDEPLENITLTLLDENGDPIATTTTASNGSYLFPELIPGDYTVVQTDLAGYQSVTPNSVATTVTTGQTSTVDFVDEQLGAINGTVTADTNNDDTGDVTLANVSITLLDENGDPVATTTTDSNGAYEFLALAPGDYTIVQTDLAGYQSVTPNSVATTVTAGQTSTVDFVDEQLGTLNGTVTADTNNDDTGDAPLANVTITLLDENGDPIATTTTDSNGAYEFLNLAPGDCTVVQTDLAGFQSITSKSVATTVTAGQTSTVDFVDEQLGEISGCVHEDLTGNGSGDQPIENVIITLLDANGDVLATTTTDSFGIYRFSGLPAGSYTVVQTQPSGFLSVRDEDVTADTPGSPADEPNSDPLDNLIPVTLAAGETDDGNDFIEVRPSSVSGFVLEDITNDTTGDRPLADVLLTLRDAAGEVVATTTTDGTGYYQFIDLYPGTYTVVQTQPLGFDSVADTDGGDLDIIGDIAPITLTPGSTSGGNTFVERATVRYTLGGWVRDDVTGGGDLDDTINRPVSGVIIDLYLDMNGDGLLDDDDILLGSTVTDANGDYRFSDLSNGGYIIVENALRPSTPTNDRDGVDSPNLIAAVIDGADSLANDFLDVVDPAGYFYDVITGQILTGGSISVSGPGGVIITQNGSTGQYSFVLDPANLVPGSYTMTIIAPPGYLIDSSRPVTAPSFDPTGGPDPTALGAYESTSNPGFLTDASAGGNPYFLTFDLAPGDPLVINNNLPFIPAKPSTWPAWQYLNPLGGENQPGDNPDGDRYDNLQEFAFCFQPNTGLKPRCPIQILIDPVTGRADLRILRVTGIVGVTYTVETITTLDASPGGWSDLTSIVPTITFNSDGTEWATYSNVGSLAPASTSGFFRVRLELDTDLDGNPEATSLTETVGVVRRTFATQCETFSMPFLICERFTGQVDSVIGSVLNISSSVGSGHFADSLASGTQYYVEVIEGSYEGHRFEVNEAASTQNGIALDMASLRNTLPSLPSDLAGDRVAVRAHHTLDTLFDKTKLTATNSPATADRLQFHSGGSFLTYWLYANNGAPYWVLDGDAALTNQGARVVDADEGLFLRPKSGTPTFTFSGYVRSNAFASPLIAGSTFVGGGWPMDQSPASRAMSSANGFFGSNNPAIADKLQIWRGDSEPNVNAFHGYFLLQSGAINQWTSEQNAALINQNNTALLRTLRAAFILSRSANPGYVMPNPWTP